jgi:hypothetical protein
MCKAKEESTGFWTEDVQERDNLEDLNIDIIFKVCKSVHHRLVQINHQPDATVFQFIILDVYLQLNMFRAFPRPSSGAQ